MRAVKILLAVVLAFCAACATPMFVRGMPCATGTVEAMHYVGPLTGQRVCSQIPVVPVAADAGAWTCAVKAPAGDCAVYDFAPAGR